MQIKIDKHNKTEADALDGRADRLVGGLKQCLESGEPLMAWITSGKLKLPISSVSAMVQYLSAVVLVLMSLALLVFDVYSDSNRTKEFRHHFHFMSNANATNERVSINPEEMLARSEDREVDVECKAEEIIAFNASTASEADRYSASEWNQLYVISTVHLVLPWLFFMVAAGCTKRENQWAWRTIRGQSYRGIRRRAVALTCRAVHSLMTILNIRCMCMKFSCLDQLSASLSSHQLMRGLRWQLARQQVYLTQPVTLEHLHR